MIEFRNAAFSYEEGIQSIRRLNLHVKQGECVVLCGKSGCGKTTVTKLANGLIPHLTGGRKEGVVTIEGKNIDDVPMYRLSAVIGSVFQNPKSQFFNLDTDSELSFVLQNQGVPAELIEERLDEMTRELDLDSLRGRNLFNLSGGEKQLIAIASVCAADPPVYVFDEPTANLDMMSIYKFQQILRKLREKGKTILIAEHRLSYLFGIADRIIYMEDGRIEREFSGDEFYEMTEVERVQLGLRSLTDHTKSREIPFLPKGKRMMKVCNAEVAYGKETVLRHVTFSAYRGDIIGIVGNNGVGKSTLCRAICGLHPIRKGYIQAEGSRLDEKARRKRSYTVMQDVNCQLFRDSVWEECKSTGGSDEEIESVLKRLELLPFKNKHPMALSGGQKQRLVIAVSLLLHRDVYIFDEPTSGLDYSSMMHVKENLEELAGKGAVVFLITHDMELLDGLCSRCLFIQKNGITELFQDSRNFSGIIRECFQL